MKKPDKTAEAYKAIKAALKARRENVKYFTLAFYKTYMQCRAKADNNIKAGNYSVGIDNVILSQAGQSEMPESITFNANVSMATGITETQSEDINKRNVMYDIMGRKMNNSPRHGIYIMNGKKIIK